MRRTVVLLASMTLAVLLASGVALAINTIQCKKDTECVGTQGDDTLLGTRRVDWMIGRKGNDTLNGDKSLDYLYGSEGRDRLVGGIGSFSDYLDGGPGSDKLEGGGDRDFIYFRSAEWGNDTITGNGVSGSTDRVDFHSLSVALTIGLNSDSGTPEVTNAATTSTVNWSDNVIEQVVAGKGNDTITGNMIRGGYFNYIHGKGGDDLIMVNDGFGNDEVHCGENPDGSQDNDEVYYDAGDTVSNCETQHLG